MKVRHYETHFAIHKRDYSSVALYIPDEETANHLLNCLNSRQELLQALAWAFSHVPIKDNPIRYSEVARLLKSEGLL